MLSTQVVYSQPIVDVEESFIIKEPDTDAIKKTVRLAYLWMYQDIDNFQSNLTITSHQVLDQNTLKPIDGKMLFCYVAKNNASLSYQAFKDECKSQDKTNKTVWTIVSNANIQPD